MQSELDLNHMAKPFHPTLPWVTCMMEMNARASRPQSSFRIFLRLANMKCFVAYTPHGNRATNVPVTVKFSGGTKTVVVNQRKQPPVRNLLLSLGTFEFTAGREGFVEISNTGTDGHVIVDAVQWVPK